MMTYNKVCFSKKPPYFIDNILPIYNMNLVLLHMHFLLQIKLLRHIHHLGYTPNISLVHKAE